MYTPLRAHPLSWDFVLFWALAVKGGEMQQDLVQRIATCTCEDDPRCETAELGLWRAHASHDRYQGDLLPPDLEG